MYKPKIKMDLIVMGQALKDWQSSKREYRVDTAYREDVKALLYNNSKLNLPEFIQGLSKGIPCDFLRDRLELIESFEWREGKQSVFEWHLKPHQVEEGVIDINLNRTMIAHDLECEIGSEFNLTNKQYETIIGFVRSEAIEFAEWIVRELFTLNKNEWTSDRINYSGCVYTTKELYALFKTRKPNN